MHIESFLIIVIRFKPGVWIYFRGCSQKDAPFSDCAVRNGACATLNYKRQLHFFFKLMLQYTGSTLAVKFTGRVQAPVTAEQWIYSFKHFVGEYVRCALPLRCACCRRARSFTPVQTRSLRPSPVFPVHMSDSLCHTAVSSTSCSTKLA